MSYGLNDFYTSLQPAIIIIWNVLFIQKMMISIFVNNRKTVILIRINNIHENIKIYEFVIVFRKNKLKDIAVLITYSVLFGILVKHKQNR